MKGLFAAAVVACLGGFSSAWALSTPVRELRAYPQPQRESVVRVRTARVLVANYGLLRRDFPELAGFSDSRIDEWLLDHAGYMAKPQVQNPLSDQLNTPIDADINDLISAYRPENYGRGLVFKAGQGLLDGKGFGALAPRLGINGSGLLPTHEAVREFVWEGIVNDIFETNGAKFETVRTYAVIDWGFDAKTFEGDVVPAGAVLRQAHAREQWNFNSNLPRDVALEIELLLRHYGVTSAGLSESLRRQSQVPYDLINVQGKRLPGGGAAVVDFGTFVRVPEGHEFERPIAVRENRFFSPAVLENTQGANRETGVLSGILAPDADAWIRAATFDKALPPEYFATPASRLYPESDQVSVRALEWVRAFRAGLGQGYEAARAGFLKKLAALRGQVKLPSSCEAQLRGV